MQGKRILVLLAALLLLAVPLTGCMEQGPSDGGDDGDGDGGELTEQEARQRFQGSLGALQQGSGDIPDRMSMKVTFDAANGTSGSTEGTMEVLVDTEGNIAIMEMTGSAFQSGSDGDSSALDTSGGFLFAQVAKTVFFGSASEGLYGIYNESQEEVQGMQDLDNSSFSGSTGGMGGTGGFLDPATLLNLTEDVPEDAEISYERTTYQGKDAIEIEMDVENGTAVAHVRAIIWLDPDRPALMEFEYEPGAGTSGPIDQEGTVRMEFQYGDDASHAQEEGVKRLESMTFLNASDLGFGGFGGSSSWSNYTIQPSANPGSVPLEEVTAHVANSSFEGESQVVLSMPLEDGSAENSAVALTYEDVDGDGMVSPGDELRLEKKNDDGSYTLSLEDEVTGLKLMPGFELLALLGSLGVASLLGRRRD